jgi:hypothetical protein
MIGASQGLAVAFFVDNAIQHTVYKMQELFHSLASV